VTAVAGVDLGGSAPPRVAVVGGGLSGITAALRLADAGGQVVLYESRARLGGLTHSFRRGALDVDNGQHVFLRCCHAYRRLLDRLGVADQVRLQDRLDIPIRTPSRARPARLRRNGLPAPLHLSTSLLRYDLLSPMQRVRFVRAALALRAVDRTDPAVDQRSFGDWLREHGQDAWTVDALWNLVGVATLNAFADDASLALAAMVFQVGLLDQSGAADIGWAAVPLQQLHGDAAERALRRAGVTIHTATKVEAIGPRSPEWIVSARGADDVVDAVILAVPAGVAERLAPAGSVAATPGWSAGLGSSPIVNLHVVLDRRVLAEPFVAGVGTPIQWVFDRTEQSKLSARQNPAGQYLAVSLSAADAFIDVPVNVLREQLLPELARLIPAVAGARVLDFFVTREREATFRPAPGSGALRPPAVTAATGLFLAGAWTDTGWPSTMEGAARSGETAAEALLAGAAHHASLAMSTVPGGSAAAPLSAEEAE
jgi:hydroxysqualene dehydroxylase